jgi:hypothetical protein
MRGQSIASLRTFSQAKPRDMVSLLSFVHYSTESEAAHRKTGFRGGARRKWRISGKMLLKCTAHRARSPPPPPQ